MTHDIQPHAPTVYIGCPVWAFAKWKGNFFTAKAIRKEFLKQYSSVFNTVEVNSTFYALPSRETVEHWCESTPEGFHFCPKFPKSISHETKLVDCPRDSDAFFSILSILKKHNRLGPAFLQLPPYFSGADLPKLVNYLSRIPREFRYAVEVRHLDWFDMKENETQLDAVLSELEIDRCLFDSRPLFSAPPSDSSEKEAQRKKPRSPFRTTVTGQRPMVRMVGRNNCESNEEWWSDWAEIAAHWLKQELTPYLFTHAPNELHAPELGESLWKKIQEHSPGIPPMPAWPGRLEPSVRQPTLF